MRTGALMAAALIYQHASREADRAIADHLDGHSTRLAGLAIGLASDLDGPAGERGWDGTG